MGHNTLGVIPNNVKWRRVVGLLGSDAAGPEVFAASAQAAERDLLDASDDPVFVEAVRLLLAIPAAARSEDFGDALRQLDLSVVDQPELLDIIVATGQRLDNVRRSTNRRTDLGELAGRALTATLSDWIGNSLPGLFEATADDVRLAARTLSYSKRISELTRGYFANLTKATLAYWLERDLSNHVGADARFAAQGSRSAFDEELGAYAHEATRIIKEFSSGWYGKTLHDRGGFSEHDAASFGAVSLKKIVAELKVKRVAHG
ncbi:hypothetical protein [Pelagovum pacificum]|uniref:Uncharacterized protein n=2 Tax=Pelagovum pacificum TaxID=2588711 RepID=A0A5C5G9U0_9RHOB|nr:hypothetical protein [Pelagovum pacificum]TNY30792.1 hypothetical protein FHY64_16880 [Pelagovum pacificum]